MNWEAWAPAIIAAVSSAYTHGKLTQKVEGNVEDIKEIRTDIKEIRTDITDHSERIGRLEGFVAPKR